MRLCELAPARPWRPLRLLAAALSVCGACDCKAAPDAVAKPAATPQPAPPREVPLPGIVGHVPRGDTCTHFPREAIAKVVGIPELPEGTQRGDWTCRFGQPSEPSKFIQVQIGRGSAATMRESFGGFPGVEKKVEKIAEGGYSSTLGAGARVVALSKGRVIQVMGPADVEGLKKVVLHVIATLDR